MPKNCLSVLGYTPNPINDEVTGKIFHVKGLQISSKGVVRLPKVQEERIDKHVADGE